MIEEIINKESCTSTIAIVDDNQTFLNIVKSQLKQYGFGNVSTFNDPKKFLDEYKSIDNIGLVLCDIDMPDIDGFGVLEEMRKNPDYIPFAFFSGLNQNDKRIEKAIEQDDYVLDVIEKSSDNNKDSRFLIRIKLALKHGKDRLKRIENEQRLVESASKYRNLVDTSPNIIYKLDHEGIIEFISPRIEDILGYKPKSLVGNHISQIVHEDDQDRVSLLTERRTGGGRRKTKRFDMRLTHKDGEDPDVEVLAECEARGEYANGWKGDGLKKSRGTCTSEFLGTYGTITDITERKKTEESMQLFWTLINQSSDAIYIINPNTGNFIDVNETACKSLGYSKEELLERGVTTIEGVLPDDFSWQKHVDNVREEGFLNVDGTHKRKDGTTFPVDVNVRHISIEGKDYMLAIARDITDIKQAEERYKNLVESSIDCIFQVDSEGTLLFANSSLKNITGYSLKEINQVNALSIIHPDDYEYSLENLSQLFLDTNSVTNLEFRIKTKNGQYRSMLASAIVESGNGDPTAVCVMKDITERKQAEDALRETEERYRSFLYGASDYFHIVDKDLRIIFANPSMIERLNEGNLIGKDLLSIFAEPMSESEIESITKKLIQKGSTQFEHQWRTKEGESIYGEVHLFTIYDSEGEFNGANAIFHDITERKKAEEALKASKAKYLDLYDHAPDMFVSVDAKNGLIRECNQTLATKLGYSKRDIIGRHILDMYHPDCIEKAQAAFNIFVEKGQVDNAELVLQRKDGSTIDVMLNVSSVRDEKGNVLYSRSSWRDITEKKKISHALNERVKELNCLYGLAEIIEQPGISLEDIMKEAVEIISPSWQYPEITYGRIILEDKEYATDNYKKTEWQQSADIISNGEKVGVIEVGYLEEIPNLDEGPFIKEERNLINALAERLGKVIQRKSIEDQLKIKDYAINAAVNAVALADFEGRLTYVNPAFVDMWGYQSQEEIIGQDVSDFWQEPQDAAEVIERLWKGGHWKGELYGRRKDDSIFPAYLSANMVKDNDGKPIAMMASFIDKTERDILAGVNRIIAGGEGSDAVINYITSQGIPLKQGDKE